MTRPPKVKLRTNFRGYLCQSIALNSRKNDIGSLIGEARHDYLTEKYQITSSATLIITAISNVLSIELYYHVKVGYRLYKSSYASYLIFCS